MVRDLVDVYGATPTRIASIAACWGVALATELAADLPSIVADLEAHGFVAIGPLTGGIAGIAVSGTYANDKAVAKISPSRASNRRQVAAARHWGPALTPEIHAAGDRWHIMNWAGQPLTGPGDRDLWTKAVTAVAAMDACGPAADPAIPVLSQFLDGYIALAAGRSRAMDFHGPPGIRELAELAFEINQYADWHVDIETLGHGDLHDANWLVDAGTVRFIDPEPHQSTVGENVARWILGGGVAFIEERAQFAVHHGAIPVGHEALVALWLRFVARERAGALIHHHKPVEWGQRLVDAGTVAAEIVTSPHRK